MSVSLSNINSLLFVLIFALMLIDATVAGLVFTFANYVIFLSLIVVYLLNIRILRFDFNALVLTIPVMGACLLSVLAAEDLHLGGYNTAIFVLLLLSFFPIVSMRFNRRLMNTLVLTFGVALAMASYYAWASGAFVFLGIKANAGAFLNSNSLGEFVLFMLIYSLLFFRNVKWQAFSLLFFLPFLLISNSRGSLLALVIFAAFYMYHFAKSADLLFLKTFLIIFCSICFVLGLSYMFADEVQVLLNKLQQSGTSGRMSIWEKVIEKIMTDVKSFFFGSGPSTTVVKGKSAHNSYLNESSNMGVFFVVFYLILLIYKYMTQLKVGNKFFLSVFFPILFLGAFESILFVNNILWVLLIFCSIQEVKTDKGVV